MHKIAVGGGHAVLDTNLLAAQNELLKLTVRGNECDGSGCFVSHATFGAEYRVAKMNAPADAITAGKLLKFFDELNG